MESSDTKFKVPSCLGLFLGAKAPLGLLTVKVRKSKSKWPKSFRAAIS